MELWDSRDRTKFKTVDWEVVNAERIAYLRRSVGQLRSQVLKKIESVHTSSHADMKDAEVQLKETMKRVTDRMSQLSEIAPVGERLDDMYHNLSDKVKETLTLCNPETHSPSVDDPVDDQQRSLQRSPVNLLDATESVERNRTVSPLYEEIDRIGSVSDAGSPPSIISQQSSQSSVTSLRLKARMQVQLAKKRLQFETESAQKERKK